MTRIEKKAVKLAVGIIRNVRALDADEISVEEFSANQRRLWAPTDSSPKMKALVSDALNDHGVGWGLPAATRRAFREAQGCHPVSMAVCDELEAAA